MCLVLIDTSECPANLTWSGEHELPSCDSVDTGELCGAFTGDSCGTDTMANNCVDSDTGALLETQAKPWGFGSHTLVAGGAEH